MEQHLNVPMSNVVPINSYQRPSSTGAGEAFASAPDQSFSIQVERRSTFDRFDANVLDAPELYPDLEVQDGRVIQALRLLKECSDHLQSATEIDTNSDFIDYDEKMMRVRNALRNLYALRGIGDGFGATISAVIWSLRKKESEPLTAQQISKLVEVLSQLRRKPMLHFDSAMNLLDQLEDSNLDFDPPFLDLLTEFENE